MEEYEHSGCDSPSTISQVEAATLASLKQVNSSSNLSPLSTVSLAKTPFQSGNERYDVAREQFAAMFQSLNLCDCVGEYSIAQVAASFVEAMVLLIAVSRESRLIIWVIWCGVYLTVHRMPSFCGSMGFSTYMKFTRSTILGTPISTARYLPLSPLLM